MMSNHTDSCLQAPFAHTHFHQHAHAHTHTHTHTLFRSLVLWPHKACGVLREKYSVYFTREEDKSQEIFQQ